MDTYTNLTPVIEIREVSKRFSRKLDLAGKIAKKVGARVDDESVCAVDVVDLKIEHNEVLGLVGESGCGKSTLGRIVAGIYEPSQGSILFNGKDLTSFKGREAKNNALKIQMIFQDPFASLNPRMRVPEIIGEAPRVHGLVKASELEDYIDELMVNCGLDPSLKYRYPHQFSGGQRQRIAIARALAVKPEFLVCDEMVSALDVSVQAQILNLFMEKRQEFGLTTLFISHDLGVVEYVSDRIAIMYLGRIVELVTTEKLSAAARHPYTRALLSGVLTIDKRRIQFDPIKGEVPSPIDAPPGCHFHPRCPVAREICREARPPLTEVETDQFLACHLR